MKDCNQCGKCCIKYGGNALYASRDDIQGWELFNPEISAYVKNEQIWYDPISSEKLETCPFLETLTPQNPQEAPRYTCAIYENRPEDCRAYPSLIAEMITDECEMLDPVDIQKPWLAEIQLKIRNERS